MIRGLLRIFAPPLEGVSRNPTFAMTNLDFFEHPNSKRTVTWSSIRYNEIMEIEKVFATLVFLALLIFWGWMFRDMVNNNYLKGNSKALWLAAFLVLFVVGAGLYYFIIYRPDHS